MRGGGEGMALTSTSSTSDVSACAGCSCATRMLSSPATPSATAKLDEAAIDDDEATEEGDGRTGVREYCPSRQTE